MKTLLSPFLSNLSDLQSQRDHKLESKLDEKEEGKKERPYSPTPWSSQPRAGPSFNVRKEIFNLNQV